MWTEYVTTKGVQGVDPVAVPPTPAGRVAQQVRRDAESAALEVGGPPGGGTLLTERVLVVSQKAKLIEVHAEYAIYNQQGQLIGAVREVGQSLFKKTVGSDGASSHRLLVLDTNGQVLMTLTQPVALIKAKVMVRTPDGTEIGQIVKKWASLLGRMTFSLERGGQPLGSINAEDRTSWEFNIQDAVGNEIARVSKTKAGLAKELFTKGDNYVVSINRPLEDPLRSLVIAAALALDTMLHQR